MPNSNLELRKNVNSTYKNAESTGFDFTRTENRYNKSSLMKAETLEIINNKVSKFWIIGCVLGIIGSICIAYFQAYAAKTSIEGFLDPLGEGNIPNQVTLAIGIGISIFGLIIGHLMYESIEFNKYTDEKKYKPQFWLYVLFASFYVVFQYVLAKTAGENVNEGQIDYMPYVVSGLAIIELIIGAVVLEKAMAYIVLFIVNIMLGISLRKMGRKSRKTNNTYRDYLTLLNAYNSVDTANPITREGNDNIRRAIAFYSNIKLEESNQTEFSKPIQEIKPLENESKVQKSTESESSIKVVKPNEAEEHLEEFMKDTIEEDLTA